MVRSSCPLLRLWRVGARLDRDGRRRSAICQGAVALGPGDPAWFADALCYGFSAQITENCGSESSEFSLALNSLVINFVVQLLP